MPPAAAPPLILGSTSRYRAELLGRLGLPFTQVAPEVDETPQPGEAPKPLAERLALAKAQAVGAQHPAAWVLGSDQVANLNGQPLGKPHTHARAVAQLLAMQGQTVVFHTAVALVGPAGQWQACADVAVRFRPLTRQTIERYLHAEQPYDCAGSAKTEGLGIALLEAMDSDDPTAIVGLPLIRTAAMLRQAGYTLP
jgi:septum formation protein